MTAALMKRAVPMTTASGRHWYLRAAHTKSRALLSHRCSSALPMAVRPKPALRSRQALFRAHAARYFADAPGAEQQSAQARAVSRAASIRVATNEANAS